MQFTAPVHGRDSGGAAGMVAGRFRRRGVVHYSFNYTGIRGLAYQETGSALPSSYPAADWIPTRDRVWNSATLVAPA